MQPIVDRHGSGAVYEAGLRALGYPPTWVTGAVEMLAVKRAMD